MCLEAIHTASNQVTTNLLRNGLIDHYLVSAERLAVSKKH